MEHDRKWDEAYSSGTYRQRWGIPYPSQELISFVAAINLPISTTALDVGCGAGQESIFLAQHGFRVIGVDLSPEGLKIAEQNAREAGVSIDWHLANISDLPIADHSIDLINDRGCFHVIPDEQRASYASSLARVLKSGGKVLLRGCRKSGDIGHFIEVTPDVIHQYFGQNFTWGPIIPIQLANGHSAEGLDANLVVLTRKSI